MDNYRNSASDLPDKAPPSWYSNDYVQSSSKRTPQEYIHLTPQEIYQMLTKYVIEQNSACKSVAIMMYQHLHGHRSVNMIAGPSGSGKSFLTETLKAIFPDVVLLRNIADLSCDGWSGQKKVSSIFKDINNTYSPYNFYQKFIVLDECDKTFAPKTSSGGGTPSEDVQSELLSFIHGCDLNIATGKDSSITLSTRNMSFLFAGSFEKRAIEIASDKSASSIGFNSSFQKVQTYATAINMDDVRAAGCITELCGRIGTVIPLQKISIDSFRKMLDSKNAGPLCELEREFDLQFRLSDTMKDEICHTAWSSDLGVRSIKNQLRKYVDEAIWNDCNTNCIEIE